MSVINSNLSSVNAQNNLSKSQASLATSMQRLSSGLRVNSAKDDAAGLSIATKMDSQIRGMSQAVRNANDGISLAQTKDGALSNATDVMQRMRELAVQAANATNTANDSASLNKEYQALSTEVSRLATDTQFNGTSVLASSSTATSIQVGAQTGLGQQIAIPKTDLQTVANTLKGVPTGTAAGLAATAASTLATTVAADAAVVTTAATAASTGLAADLTAAATAVTTAATAKTASDTAATASLADPVEKTTLTTASQSTKAIVVLDAALTSVNDMRADLGAVENRLGHSVSNLQNSVENQSAAKSRIMDTDFAAETANLSRAQVLQQAGTAMVAQANQLPQGVMALLR